MMALTIVLMVDPLLEKGKNYENAVFCRTFYVKKPTYEENNYIT